MPPSLRVLQAFGAMRDLGIAEEKVKPVLKKLLKVYEKNWELIEVENYRALADAIFEADEKEEETNRQHQNNERQIQNTFEEVQEEPERPLKRLRLRNQEGHNSDNPRTENQPHSPQTATRNKEKQPLVQDRSDTPDVASREEANLARIKDKGKEPLVPQNVSKEKRVITERSSQGIRFEEPKIEPGVILVASQKTPPSALVKPKDKPVIEEVPIAVIRPEFWFNMSIQDLARQRIAAEQEARRKNKSLSKRPAYKFDSGTNVAEISDVNVARGTIVADPLGKSFRAERMSRISGQSVLNSKVGGPSLLSFLECQVRADQVELDKMPTEDVVATMADYQMKAIQCQINLVARAGRFQRELDKKNDQLELAEKRYAKKVMELETAMTSHSADLKELTIERQKNAELEAAFQKLQLENEAEKAARATDKVKAEACFKKIMEELEKSGPVLRMEAARAFMKSRTFKEFLVKESMNDQFRALEVVVGQLKKKGLLPVEFDEYDIDLSLDADGEVPLASGQVDDRVLAEDEFFELFQFDPSSEADKDSSLEEISRLKLTTASEAKEAGLTLPGCGSIDSGGLGP